MVNRVSIRGQTNAEFSQPLRASNYVGMKKSKRKTAETLNYLWAAGLAITLAVAFGIYTLNKYGDLVYGNVRFLAWTLALSAATVLLFTRYLTACHHELSLLEEYLGASSAPRVDPGVYYNVFLLAVVFGVLIAMSHLIMVYSALIIIFNLADLWGGWQGEQKIKPLFEKKLSQHLAPTERKIIEIIRYYYLGNPTLERVATVMFVNFIACSSALVAHFTGILWWRDLAYLIVILNICVGELVMYRWRRRRDRMIAAVDPTSA